MKFFYSHKILNPKYSSLKKLVALTLVMFNFMLFAQAQNDNGKVTGKLYDASTNETLIGVIVNVEGTKIATTTDPNGSYLLSLPIGTYTLNFRYIGYQTKQLSGVEVKKAQTTFQNIILKTASQQLQTVVVTSTVKKESQSAVYSAQKRSSAVSDGISQEAIRKTPDNNAAQVLTRVTGINIQDNRFVVVRGLGDQYNQTMVNGVQMTSTETDRNAFSFDLIPAAVIDNIVVNKTATPDMPGNFAGGVVQINTKDFPDNNFVSVSLQGGFSDQTLGKDFYSDKRTPLEFLSFGGTSRNLPKGYPTDNGRVPENNYNIQERYRYLRMLPNNLIAINNGPSQPNQQVQIGFGRTINLKNNTKFGIVASLNQRKTELIEEETNAGGPTYGILSVPSATVLPLLGLSSYSEHKRYNYAANFGAVVNLAYRFNKNIITLKTIYTSIFRNTYVDRPNLYTDAYKIVRDDASLITKGINYITDQKNILNSILGGEHKTGADNATKLDWNINFTKNSTNTPDTRNFLFKQILGTELYFTNTDIPEPSAPFGQYSRVWSKNLDFIYGGAFNVTTTTKIANKKSLFKSGVLFQNRERNVNGKVLPIGTGSNPVALIDFFSPSQLHPNLTQVGKGFDILSIGVDYSAGSSLLAAYESLENRFGEKIRLIWGIRVENYQQSVNVYNEKYNTNFIIPDKESRYISSRTTFNFLPSVNAVYSPVDKLNLRVAFSNTAIRPELRDLTPITYFDLQSFANIEGNPNLKTTNITNYDLKLEYFPSAGEIFSVGAFYKQLSNPIEYTQSISERITLRKPLNTGNAYVQGIEAEIRKKINFLGFAPWLKNVSLFGNATLLKSQVAAKKFNDPDGLFSFFDAHTLTGQAKYIANAGISVAAFKNTFETTLSYNKTGDYINNLGSSDLFRLTESGTYAPVQPHFMVAARDMLDLVLSQALYNRKMQIRFKASNLLKAPFIIYQDNNGNGKFDEPVRIIVDINSEPFTNYKSGIDNTPSYIEPQRTYTLALSYTF